MEKAVLFRIKEGKIDQWRAWCAEVQTALREEARISLIEEKVLQEASLCFKVGESWYGIGYMEGEGLPANPKREINIRHKQAKKECLEYISDAEVLYSIKA